MKIRHESLCSEKDAKQTIFRQNGPCQVYAWKSLDPLQKFYDNQFEKADFLKSSFDLKEEPTKSKERGIQRTKKDEIMHRLAPLMPRSRHTFWQNLHVNEKVKDLAVDYEKRVSLYIYVAQKILR